MAGQWGAREAVVAEAHDLIAGQCSGRRQWRMTIPVRHDDHDILISAALDRQTAEIERLRAIVSFYEPELENDNPHKPQGTTP